MPFPQPEKQPQRQKDREQTTEQIPKKKATQAPQEKPKKIPKYDENDDRPPEQARRKTTKPVEENKPSLNVLDDLERVDDNGVPIPEPRVKDYEAENKPYQMFFNEDGRKKDDKNKAQPPSPKKKSKFCAIF